MVQEGSTSTGSSPGWGEKVFSLNHVMGSEEQSCSLIYSAAPRAVFIIIDPSRSFSFVLQVDILVFQRFGNLNLCVRVGLKR